MIARHRLWLFSLVALVAACGGFSLWGAFRGKRVRTVDLTGLRRFHPTKFQIPASFGYATLSDKAIGYKFPERVPEIAAAIRSHLPENVGWETALGPGGTVWFSRKGVETEIIVYPHGAGALVTVDHPGIDTLLP